MKRFLKRTIYIISFIMVLPFIIVSWLEAKLSNSETIFCSIGQLISLIPGKIGSYLRAAFYTGALEKCSWELFIGMGSFFSHRNARIGRNVSIGAYSIIGCAIIEDGVIIGSRVSITSGKRQHIDSTGKLTKNISLTVVTIGSNSWIGENAVVMGDLGAHCIVGAGSVVTKKAPSDILAMGNPARFMKKPEINIPPKVADDG